MGIHELEERLDRGPIKGIHALPAVRLHSDKPASQKPAQVMRNKRLLKTCLSGDLRCANGSATHHAVHHTPSRLVAKCFKKNFVRRSLARAVYHIYEYYFIYNFASITIYQQILPTHAVAGGVL